MMNNVMNEMICKITSTSFAKANIEALFCEPKFLKEEDKWIDFYYSLKTAPSVEECLQFEKEVSLMFADCDVCCDISHIDYAPEYTKEDGCIWEN